MARTTHTTHISHPRRHVATSSAKRGHSHSTKLTPAIRRALLVSFNNSNYTANVLLLEATNTYLQNVPIAYHVDGTSAQTNNLCAVLFFDEQNYTDAVILAIFPNINQGAPAYPPSRLTFVPPYTFINNVTINSGTTNTYTLTNPSTTNVPRGALGVLIQAHFTSAATGTYVNFWSHGGSNNGFVLGNLYTANGFVNGCGIVKFDGSGKIDVSANGGDCAIFANLYGYFF